MNTTTEEKNRVLAEFMELEDAPDYIKHDFGRDDVYFIEGEYSEARYGTSFDWIMPVVEKVSKLAAELNHPHGFELHMFIVDGVEWINDIHEACYQFAVWYKENSHS